MLSRFLRFSLVVPALAATLVLSGCPFGPRLGVNTEVVRFNFDPVTQTYETVATLTVSNTGRGDLNVTITSDQPWLTVNPATAAAIQRDEPLLVTLTVDRAYSDLKAADFSTALVRLSSNGGNKRVTATVAPDYFTQAFAPGEVDLDGLSLTFTPNGGPSFYGATKSDIDELPTDPTAARAFPLNFAAFGDPVKAGLFGAESVNFYGKEYDTLFISSQGWISFGTPGNDPLTVRDHLRVPQISGLPVDASQDGSVVSYLQDEEKLVITYENSPTKGAPGFTNDFQVELFFEDGTVQLSYLNVDPALSGIIGLSGGFAANGSVPADFVQSDLTNVNTGPLKVVQ